MEIDAKPENLQVFPLEEDKKYLNKSLYIPARQTNMMRIIELFWRHKYGKFNLSEFVNLCIREYVNNLSKEDKKIFEECSHKLSKMKSPTTTQFVEKFLKNPKI